MDVFSTSMLAPTVHYDAAIHKKNRCSKHQCMDSEQHSDIA